MEPGKSVGRGEADGGEGWSRVMALIELAKKADETEWTAERRERIFQRVVARAEEERERRRVRRAFAAGAGMVLVAGLLLVGIGGPALLRASPELASKMGLRLAAAD